MNSRAGPKTAPACGRGVLAAPPDAQRLPGWGSTGAGALPGLGLIYTRRVTHRGGVRVCGGRPQQPVWPGYAQAMPWLGYAAAAAGAQSKETQRSNPHPLPPRRQFRAWPILPPCSAQQVALFCLPPRRRPLPAAAPFDGGTSHPGSRPPRAAWKQFLRWIRGLTSLGGCCWIAARTRASEGGEGGGRELGGPHRMYVTFFRVGFELSPSVRASIFLSPSRVQSLLPGRRPFWSGTYVSPSLSPSLTLLHVPAPIFLCRFAKARPPRPPLFLQGPAVGGRNVAWRGGPACPAGPSGSPRTAWTQTHLRPASGAGPRGLGGAVRGWIAGGGHGPARGLVRDAG